MKAVGFFCVSFLTFWCAFQGFAQRGSEPCRLDRPVVLLQEIPEGSGIAMSRRSAGVLWAHNDSGDATVFGLDTNGAIKGRVRVANAQVDDWEDLAVGPCPKGSCLYIGDIGDNSGKRQRITVYRTPEPNPGDASTEAAEAFHAIYPDGAHDAEALFVTPEADVFVVTKMEGVVYRFPKPLRAGTTVKLERVSTVDTRNVAGPKKAAKDSRITGAAASPDGRWVVLRTNHSLLFYQGSALMSGSAVAFRFDLAALKEPQGEGVTIGSNGVIFLIGEGGTRSKPGTLAQITCALNRRNGEGTGGL